MREREIPSRRRIAARTIAKVAAIALAMLATAWGGTPATAAPPENVTAVRRFAPSLGRSVMGVARALPLCRVGDTPLSVRDLMGSGRWACYGDWANECELNERTLRPTSRRYRLTPAPEPIGEPPLVLGDSGRAGGVVRPRDLRDDAGASLFQVYVVTCERSDRDPYQDHVTGGYAIGRFLSEHEDEVVQEYVLIDGGIVEHDRAAYVSGSVRLRRDRRGTYKARGLAIALQVFRDGRWFDQEIEIVDSPQETESYTVNGFADPGAQVRLQVRAVQHRDARNAYIIEHAELFVETCIPDPADPWTCQ